MLKAVASLASLGSLGVLSACGQAVETVAERADPWAQIAFTQDAPFASEMFTFYVQDAHSPPAPCRTVFIGSSSIRFWLSLSEDFPQLDPLNRGFGGSQITHAIGYFDRLLTPHAPKEIVFYSGENDLTAGVSPDEVLARFETFMALKDDRLGNTPVYFLSIKPSVARLEQLSTQTEANALLARYADTRDDLFYVDVSTPMMDAADTPKQIFISDQLHMDPNGYAIWTEVLAPFLNNPDRPKRADC
ncbi:MAG: GDSL-type esterase/lipase family protein [Pseudomonadota bacterium]